MTSAATHPVSVSVTRTRRSRPLGALALLGLSAVAAAAALLSPATSAQAAGTNSSPGQCAASSVVQEYPNGEVPLSVLCPVIGTTNEYLRADAAYNFNRLSKAYKARFGTYIPVTDSYRSLKSQVALYQAKPKLAAKPGTSNHGLGVAADLGGGIQKYATIEHQWMDENAPKYRWVNPTWALEGSSREEPWHFEYAPRSDEVHDALGLPRVAVGGYNGYVATPVKTPVKPPVKPPVTTPTPNPTPSSTSSPTSTVKKSSLALGDL